MKRGVASLAARRTRTRCCSAASSPIVVSGQLLAYQDGFVFFTTGDGFRVAHDVVIHDAKTGGAYVARCRRLESGRARRSTRRAR